MISEVSGKGWTRFTKPDQDVKEEEIKALFNMIDNDRSGELSLGVCIFVYSSMHFKVLDISGGKKSLQAYSSQICNC